MHIMPVSGVPPTVHPAAGPASPPTVAISPVAPDSTSAPAALPSEYVYLQLEADRFRVLGDAV
jgi:hypothetical protein